MNTQDFRQLITQIKDNNNCRDFAELHLGCHFVNGRSVSPLRAEADNPTSFLADKYSWHDFGSGEHGDIIDLAARGMFRGDRAMAIEYLSGKSLRVKIDPQDVREWADKKRRLEEKVEYWHSQLDERVREYFHKRRISDETLERFKIGYSRKRERYIFPYLKNGEAMYWCGEMRAGTRRGQSISRRLSRLGWSILYGDWTRCAGVGVIRGTRGIVDVLSFAQEGWQVVSAITGRFSSEQERELFELCARYSPVTAA